MAQFREGHVPHNAGKHWSMNVKKKISESMRGRHLPENHRHEISKTNRGHIVTPETRSKISVALSGKPKSAEHKMKIKSRIPSMLGKHHSATTREKISKAHKNKSPSIEHRRRLSISLRNLWQDPEFAMKMLIAFQRKPNKVERYLNTILNKHFPQFKYNGDGSLGITLGGLIPDFVNVNGKKQVIEVFGDYWHSPEIIEDDWRRGELGKIMVYNSLGWRCLVIWEHELKELTEQQIVNKVSNFSRRKDNAHHRVPS